MQRHWVMAAMAGALALGLAACGDEEPTGLGSGLIGPGLRTYEVFLEGEEFLRSDTTYDRLGALSRVNFWLIAEDYAGELDAHTLFSPTLPTRVTYTDSAGSHTDSIAAYVGGTLTLVIDTVASTAGPSELELYEVLETWDQPTADWLVRTDTTGTLELWEQPGGTVGAQLSTATYESGDTLRIALDSQTVAVWTDSLGAARGGLLRSTTAGTRLVVRSLGFAFDVIPAENADTVVQAGAVRRPLTIVSPDAPAPTEEELRVGGVPTWRTLFHFESLADQPIPCGPEAPASCTVPLRDVTVNLATLILEPVPVGARRIERPIFLENRPVLPGPPSVPITRSPLGGFATFTQDSLPVGLFDGEIAEVEPVQVPITSFIRGMVNPGEEQEPLYWLALKSAAESSEFGYAAFASLTSPWPPRLRLVVSVPEEELTP